MENTRHRHPPLQGKFIKVLLYAYKRCFSLWPAPVPLYLLRVVLKS